MLSQWQSHKWFSALDLTYLISSGPIQRHCFLSTRTLFSQIFDRIVLGGDVGDRCLLSLIVPIQSPCLNSPKACSPPSFLLHLSFLPENVTPEHLPLYIRTFSNDSKLRCNRLYGGHLQRIARGWMLSSRTPETIPLRGLFRRGDPLKLYLGIESYTSSLRACSANRTLAWGS